MIGREGKLERASVEKDRPLPEKSSGHEAGEMNNAQDAEWMTVESSPLFPYILPSWRQRQQQPERDERKEKEIIAFRNCCIFQFNNVLFLLSLFFFFFFFFPFLILESTIQVVWAPPIIASSNMQSSLFLLFFYSIDIFLWGFLYKWCTITTKASSFKTTQGFWVKPISSVFF